MRRVRVSVLPVPAPAIIRRYRLFDMTAFFCSFERGFGVSSIALRIDTFPILSAEILALPSLQANFCYSIAQFPMKKK